MNKDHEIAFLNDPSYADAIRWARMKHDGQKRVYSKTDYVHHPIRVATELYAEEKCEKFDVLQMVLWNVVMSDNMMHSVFAAAIIRLVELYGPEGEHPDDA